MQLSNLDSKTVAIDVVLLQTPSSRLNLFLQDKIKRKFNCKTEAIISVETKSDIKKIKNVIGVNPPFSERWYVQIDLDKLNDKDLINTIKQSTTCVFFCTCSKYTTFKKFKEDLKSGVAICDFYINYLRKADLIYLYDAFVCDDNKLTPQLFSYFAQNYSGDIEAVFELLMALNQGTVVKKQSDIVEICGLGRLSTETFIFSLLKPLSGSARGLKTVLGNRIKAGITLGESLGYTSMYNFLSKTLLNFCQLKMLIMSGVVYKSVRNLPDSFDEKSLARYQRFIWRLKEIPMSELLRIRSCIGNRVWKSEEDFLNFIYKYYYKESMKGVKLNGTVN